MGRHQNSAPQTSITLLKLMVFNDDGAMNKFFKDYRKFIFEKTKYFCLEHPDVIIRYHCKRYKHNPDKNKDIRSACEQKKCQVEDAKRTDASRSCNKDKNENSFLSSQINYSHEHQNELRNIWLRRLADEKDQFQQVICHVYDQMCHVLKSGDNIGKRNIEVALNEKIQKMKRGRSGTFHRGYLSNWILWGICEALEEEFKMRGNAKSMDAIGLGFSDGKSETEDARTFEEKNGLDLIKGVSILQNEQSAYKEECKDGNGTEECGRGLSSTPCNEQNLVPSNAEILNAASIEVKDASWSLANSVMGVLRRFPKFNSICARYGVDFLRDCFLNFSDRELVARHHISQQTANNQRRSLWKEIRPFILQAFGENGADLSLVLSSDKEGKEFQYFFYETVKYLFSKEKEKFLKCKIHSRKSSRGR